MKTYRAIFYAVIELDVPEGPTIHTLNWIRGMEALGHRVLLMTPQVKHLHACVRTNDVIFLRFFGFTWPRIFLYDFLAIFSVIKQILSFRPDFFYIREMENNIWVPLVVKLMGVPLITDVNGPTDIDEMVLSKQRVSTGKFAHYPGWKSKFFKTWRKIWRLLNFWAAAGETYNVEGWRSEISREFNLSKERSLFLSMYVDTDRFKPANSDTLRMQLGILKQQSVFGYVGSFQPFHHLDLLFESFEALRKAGNDVVLVCVGDGPHRTRLEKQYEALIMQKKILLIGWVSHEVLANYINLFDVGYSVMPAEIDYRTEALLKLKEYLACGIPTMVSGNPEIFQPYPKGSVLILKEHTKEGVMEAFQQGVSVRRTPLMEQTVEMIRSTFALPCAAERMIQFLEEKIFPKFR